MRIARGPALAVLAGIALGPLVSHGSGPATVDARATYLSDCAACHGADARGTSKGPTLEGQGAAGVDFMLSTGRMPISDPNAESSRHRPAYTPAMIAALAGYVDALVPGGPPIPLVQIGAGDSGSGGEVYRQQCAACHQAAGQGGALLGQQSPSLGPSTPVQVAEAVRSGPGTMPVFSTTAIDEQQLADLAAYVRDLQHSPDPGGFALWHLGPMPEGAVALVAMYVLAIVLRRMGTRT